MDITDARPTTIHVWACPQCGYWREDKSSGIHMQFDTTGGLDRRHVLIETTYTIAADA